MKKLLTIAAFFTLAACSHQDQKVNLSLSFEEKKSEIGRAMGLDVVVIDDRIENKILGTKEFCNDDKVTISSYQDLVGLLQRKITENLAQKGFAKGGDKIVEVRIESLRYNAECSIIIGKSRAEASFKVIIIDPKTGTKITKNFDLSLKNKHFLGPLASTDEDTINDLLQEVVSDILRDDVLLKNLAQ